MKCHSEYLTSELRCPGTPSTYRRTLCHILPGRGRKKGGIINPVVILICRRGLQLVQWIRGTVLCCLATVLSRFYFWAAFVPAMYPATAPPTPPTTMDVRTTPHGQTGHDASNAANRLICVLLP